MVSSFVAEMRKLSTCVRDSDLRCITTVPPVILRGSKVRYILGGVLEITSHEDQSTKSTFKGLQCKLQNISSPEIHSGIDNDGQYEEVIVPEYFPPGSVMVFATHMEGLTQEVDNLCVSGAKEAFSRLDVVDLNIALFRADGEERDATGGRDGVYNVPGLGPFVYCGLEGFMHPLRHVMRTNDLGHPLCAHLREGCWAMDYIYGRLMK